MDQPEKIIPLCPVFGTCGGCQFQDIPYEEELCIKEAQLRQHLGRLMDVGALDIAPAVPSPKVYHYRSRVDLKLVKTRRGTLHVGFSSSEKGPVIEISACPIAMEQITSFLPKLREEALARLPSKYHLANLTVRCGDGEAVHWGGIGKRSLRLAEKDYFSTKLAGKEIFYALDTFFQANLSILPVLAEKLRALSVWSREAMFFDLYGGVGLMGVVVQDLVKGVVNIEQNVHSVKLARYNIDKNALLNVRVLEGKVEDVLPGLLAQEFQQENIVMVDPPRAGLSPESIALLNHIPKARYLLYLSCNPETLAANLSELTAGAWSIDSIQPFDFFPRTRHLETLVCLRQKV